VDAQKRASEIGEDQQVQAAPRAQLPDVARLTGIPERTLQHWFREYGSYRSRRGYPQQLIVDVLRDHEWEGDTAALLRGLVAGPAPELAIERHAPVPLDIWRGQEERLAAITAHCERLSDELAAFRSQHAEIIGALLQEIQQLRAQSTQVATLNELRGVRDDLLAVRAGQQRVEQAIKDDQEHLVQMQTTLARRRWWPFARS
jgi:hypothetical protein